jgi:hypothetical protein
MRRVVLLGDVVTEEDVGERLEPVGVVAGHVDGHGIVVADVAGPRLAALAVEHDDARRSAQAREEVVLVALVVVEAADDALPRERDVRLAGRLRKGAVSAQLDEPAPLVGDVPERDDLDPVDHRGCSRTQSTTA